MELVYFTKWASLTEFLFHANSYQLFLLFLCCQLQTDSTLIKELYRQAFQTDPLLAQLTPTRIQNRYLCSLLWASLVYLITLILLFLFISLTHKSADLRLFQLETFLMKLNSKLTGALNSHSFWFSLRLSSARLWIPNVFSQLIPYGHSSLLSFLCQVFLVNGEFLTLLGWSRHLLLCSIFL